MYFGPFRLISLLLFSFLNFFSHCLLHFYFLFSIFSIFFYFLLFSNFKRYETNLRKRESDDEISTKDASNTFCTLLTLLTNTKKKRSLQKERKFVKRKKRDDISETNIAVLTRKRVQTNRSQGVFGSF